MISICLLYGKLQEIYDNLNSTLKETINYLIVGVLTTIVSITSYYLLRTIINDYKICTVLSWIIAVLFAYVTNRIFVFKSKEKRIFKEFISFIGSRIFSLLAELLCMFVMVQLINIPDRIAKIIVQVIIIILNYILSKLFVFKKKD